MTLYNLKQNEVGHVRSEVETVTATGTVNVQDRSNFTLVINAAAAAVITLSGVPQVGAMIEIVALNITTSATVTLPAGFTWDGTNEIATLDADGEFFRGRVISASRVFVTENPASVAFSTA